MTRAQELAVQAGASANDSAAAAVLLGEVLWDMEAPRDALAAFRTAQMILTQSGLRTRQAARVLYWMARCATKLARLEAAKRDLRQAAAILTAIYPSGHADLDDVHEAQAQLFLDLKQYKRSARILTPLAAAPRRAAVSARALRLLTMRFVANASLESWGDAAVDLGRAAAEAEHLWTRLQNAGAPLCAPRLTFRPRNAEQHEGGPRVRAAALPRSERVTALQRRAMVAEVQLHLSTLVSLGCFCMHVGGRAAAGTWAPLVARAAGEALLWHDYRDAGIASALLMVADSLRGAGTTDQALHVYFCTYDYWATWADLESVRCSAVHSEITRSKLLWWAAVCFKCQDVFVASPRRASWWTQDVALPRITTSNGPHARARCRSRSGRCAARWRACWRTRRTRRGHTLAAPTAPPPATTPWLRRAPRAPAPPRATCRSRRPTVTTLRRAAHACSRRRRRCRARRASCACRASPRASTRSASSWRRCVPLASCMSAS